MLRDLTIAQNSLKKIVGFTRPSHQFRTFQPSKLPTRRLSGPLLPKIIIELQNQGQRFIKSWHSGGREDLRVRLLV